jgi:hypothetical protein
LEKIEMVKTRCTYDRNRFLAEYATKEAVKNRISLYGKRPEPNKASKTNKSTPVKPTQQPEQADIPEETEEQPEA